MLERHSILDWLGIAASLVMLVGYELRLRRQALREPERVARVTHARLRAQWIEALAKHPGSELLGVQTLRNSLMSVTIIASTWALVLMGVVSLMARSAPPADLSALLTPRAAVIMLLLSALFASFVVALISIRFFNHAGFMISLPVGSEARAAASSDAVEYLRRAGHFHSLSLRSFFGVAPLAVGLLSPALMPLFTLGVLVALTAFDHVPGPKR